ncbi:MAG: RluA family pseudouridine synthase [Clostridiaceae bacterium]|nr:RluA family pseudouridine synthase [Clostridiaceae bacterium]
MKNCNIYEIDEEYDGIRLGNYLRGKLMLSRNSLIKIKKSGSLKVNGCGAHTDTIVRIGDKVEFELPDQGSDNILPEYMPLDIIFEDDHMIVVNKEAGIPTHPSRNHYMGTLANGLMYHWMEKDRNITIRPVNRLDRNTSGLVLFAKSSHIQHLMSQESYKNKITKEYLAIVQGRLVDDSGTIDAPIARENLRSIKRVVREDGARAVTHYRVIERYEDYSLIGIVLDTGRTHQIRVHMAYLGHPLLGDELYGGSQEKIKRHALHAYNIKMLHPIENSMLDLTAKLPPDMQQLIRKYS